MNWGTRIVVGLAVFMIFIVSAGIYMVSKDTDSLIDEDYYERGLTYDDVYERKQNLVDDAAKPLIRIDTDSVFITFVAENNVGELFFRRPSDGNLDKKIPFETSSKHYSLAVNALSKGSWSLEISWENKGKRYIDTRPVFIQ